LICITIGDIYLTNDEFGGKKMKLHEEIERTAYELYKKSGCIDGRDFENWLDAERIVLTRHASQEIFVEEMEVQSPAIGTQKDISIKTEKIRPTKPATAKGRKGSPQKESQKKRGKITL